MTEPINMKSIIVRHMEIEQNGGLKADITKRKKERNKIFDDRWKERYVTHEG
jgi:hypothetical protein